jgi:hypothetical protein
MPSERVGRVTDSTAYGAGSRATSVALVNSRCWTMPARLYGR